MSLVTDPTLTGDVQFKECLETCQLRQHRHCLKAPDKCGSCLSSFVTDVDGVCQPLHQRRGGMYAYCTASTRYWSYVYMCVLHQTKDMSCLMRQIVQVHTIIAKYGSRCVCVHKVSLTVAVLE